jgi:alpha-ketoglutarate-dependent taurine dioxygenase
MVVDYNKNNKSNVLVELIISSLKSAGYILVKNFDVDTSNVEECRKKFLEISEQIGKPIPHDANNTIIWDIKSNPNSKSFVKTYSEHSHEAQLHTDSQYSFYPEDYFGLLTIKKAECGGGLSYILTLKDILEELRSLPDGKEIEHILRTTDYPFIVPNVFKKNNLDEHEFNFGPILRENEIRFRIDTFEKALVYNNNLCTKKQIQAYEVLKQIILDTKKTKSFYLEEKDLIFLNNKTLLHGRSMFTDQKRHLLRIRLNKN